MTTPKLLRLKENHPTAKKLDELWALADKLGISIYFGSHRTIVTDKDRDEKLPTLFMEDLESDDPVREFPATVEYKLIYDNPVYLEEKAKEFALEREKELAEKKARDEKLKAEKLAREKELVIKKEKEERRLLSELKAKYESA